MELMISKTYKSSLKQKTKFCLLDDSSKEKEEPVHQKYYNTNYQNSLSKIYNNQMTKSLNKVTLQKKEELQWQKEDINDLNFQLSIKLLDLFMCGDFEMLLNNNTISFPESNFIINMQELLRSDN